ncbi:hypothetical protein SAMD00019534_110600 [Acytostelium subglobosum LB1]|uniref:hypothetical protein n=1 Tax=Acytostelium subglobosum LB1 TaxID=1410327 RepID=UPI00064498AE|nr:hypothetical protein SAMD00019534_110600 [Acytostelium subglobosum LB1]GAM27884.1 hypothetical protein SAMD00019534_110600 [Acytostelium subglobosum LB1]|eukprot:XP_012749167.1 hypothetical protein SAMD00019534_110600 [Acytostelium subglobosum LB1]
MFGNNNNNNSGSPNIDPWTMTSKSNGPTWTPSTFVHQPNFDPKKVPSSIKNSQFVNITNPSSNEDPWASPVVVPNVGFNKAAIMQLKKKEEIVLHVVQPQVQPQAPPQPQPQAQPQQFTQQQQQQQQQQQSQDEESEEEINQSRYKTELCRSFIETGSCRYGFKCQFAHGRDELRSVVRHPKYKTETCKTFHTIGSCPYGSRCRFIHSLPESGKGPELQVVQQQPMVGEHPAASVSPKQQIMQHQQQQHLMQQQPSLLQQQQFQQQYHTQQQQYHQQLPTKQQPVQFIHQPAGAPITWTDSWGAPDESAAQMQMHMKQMQKPKELQQVAAPPAAISEENSKRRLQIFRSICSSNSNTWE